MLAKIKCYTVAKTSEIAFVGDLATKFASATRLIYWKRIFTILWAVREFYTARIVLLLCVCCSTQVWHILLGDLICCVHTFHDIWWHLDASTRHFMTYDDIWSHFTSFNLTWWHLMIYGDIWWHFMTKHVVYHDISWQMIKWIDLSVKSRDMIIYPWNFTMLRLHTRI